MLRRSTAAPQNGAAIGIHAEGLQADIPEIFAYKERISRQLCGGVESLLKGAGVTLLRAGPSSQRRKRPCHRRGRRRL